MKATIVKMNKDLAEMYLAKNKNNRAMSSKSSTYAEDMKAGRWKENGESIIIDKNGLIKDGQHRLYATIEANHEWLVPVVSDVNPDVMDTIDTGKNRSLSDVLEINGFTSSTFKAALIKQIIMIDRGASFYHRGGNVSKGSSGLQLNRVVTNSQGLDYALKNKNLLEDLVTETYKLWTRQPVGVYTQTDVGVFIYLLTRGKGLDNPMVLSFIKLTLGVTMDENSAATWFYKKMLKYKTGREKVNKKWVIAMFIKCWNLYINGNPPVTYLNFDIASDLPKIQKPEYEMA